MDQSLIRGHITFCILLMLVGSFAIVAFYQVNQTRQREVYVEKVSGEHQALVESLSDFYQPLAKNIEFLASHPEVQSALQNGGATESLAADFTLISSAIQGYDQIRLLDLAGKEILRVNRTGNNATVVDKFALQDKSGRDYFEAARSLGPEEIYIGPIDLNQENGSIEVPYKEVIRCAKQVFDDDQTPLGVVITNYLGNQFLPSTEATRTGRHEVLLSEDGSFLQGPPTYPKYANLIMSEPPSRFADFFPVAWEQIRANRSLHRSETSEGIFISQSIRPHADGKITGETMYLVSIIPEESVRRAGKSSWLTFLVLPMIGWWLMSGGLSLAISKRDEQSSLAQRQTMIAAHLSEQAEELRRSNEELEQFAFMASHDLQEPLRKICTFGELLVDEEKPNLSVDGVHYVDVMVDASARMRALIEALLEYSRIPSSQRNQVAVESEIAFREAIDNLSQTIEASNAIVKSDHALPTVIGDKNQLVRLFQNLIGNAIKYCQQPPQIEVNARPDGSDWHFTIEDNGIGIEPEHRETVFKVFKRLHIASEYSGTGIGLPICKRIVERNGGTIWITSSPSGGSRFHFTIPAAESR